MRSFLFFDTSKRIYSEVTELFDFIWPTAAALWNLRWQVQGYVGNRPDVDVKELQDRFVTGSGIHGANIKKACIDLTWEQQQKELSKFILFNVISLYESWVTWVLEELGCLTQDRVKQLQFPTKTRPTGRRSGVWQTISEITATESSALKNSVYDQLIRHKKNSKHELDNLMICYRYFKECRNSLIHNGGVADTKTEDAYNAFLAIATPTNLGLTEVPEHAPVSAGMPISLRIRGVVGLCDIILHLVATIDAELTRSEKAEEVFKRYWKRKFGRQIDTLKPKPGIARSAQVKQFMNKLDLPKPVDPSHIEQFLLNARLVSN